MCFSNEGYLPIGIHEMTWNEFYKQFSFSPKRKMLIEGLKLLIAILKECGCTVIYIDGSFVTRKLEPNDYDACWEGDVDSILQKMEMLYPVLLDFTNGRKSQKAKYGGEIFPASFKADSKGTLFFDFFQQVKGSDNKKGIVAIKL
jgi:hypothetical protein